jgi:DNA replication protein DnaC
MIDIAKMSSNVPEGDGYIGQDGLLHCLKCGGALETYINVLGRGDRKVRCICECMRQERDAAERRAKAEQIDRNRRICFGGSRLAKCTFEKSRETEYIKMAKNYVKHFDELKYEGKGLLLYGVVGTGKSHIAACVANALLDAEKKVLMTNFATIINTLQNSFEGRQEYINSLNRYSLLIIDDLGTERSSEYMQENVFNIIDARYRSGLPMIITTNLTGEQLQNPKEVSYARIYERILERCHPIEVKGVSIRKQKLQNDYIGVEKLLKGV